MPPLPKVRSETDIRSLDQLFFVMEGRHLSEENLAYCVLDIITLASSQARISNSQYNMPDSFSYPLFKGVLMPPWHLSPDLTN